MIKSNSASNKVVIHSKYILQVHILYNIEMKGTCSCLEISMIKCIQINYMCLCETYPYSLSEKFFGLLNAILQMYMKSMDLGY